MKFPNYEKQMLEFINEVNKIGATKDKRQMVLLLGIYSEYLTNELVRTRLSKIKFKERLSQSLRLKILLSHSLLSQKTYAVFEKLNKIRNEYAHNLIFDYKKIEKDAFNTPLNWKMKDSKTLKNANKILRKDTFDRFQKICISNIIFLFQNLGGFPSS